MAAVGEVPGRLQFGFYSMGFVLFMVGCRAVNWFCKSREIGEA